MYIFYCGQWKVGFKLIVIEGRDYTCICLEATRKTTKTLNEDRLSGSGSPQHEAKL
jgi:hypothetical protein